MSAKTMVNRDLLEDALFDAGLSSGAWDIRDDHMTDDGETCLAVAFGSPAPLFAFFAALGDFDVALGMRLAQAARETLVGVQGVVVYFPGFQLED